MLSCRKSQKVNQWRLKLWLFIQSTKLSQMGVSEYGILVPSKLPFWQGKYQVLNISKPLEFGCFIPKFSGTKAKYYIFSWSSGFWRGSLGGSPNFWKGLLGRYSALQGTGRRCGKRREHLLNIFRRSSSSIKRKQCQMMGQTWLADSNMLGQDVGILSCDKAKY